MPSSIPRRSITSPAAARRPGPTHTVRPGPEAPPVRRFPVPLARRFYQICAAVMTEAVAEAGLSALQFAILPYVSERTGDPGLDQNGIAARIGIDRNNVSLLLDQLEKKGLVIRRLNGADRRAHMVYLTPKGEKLFARIQPSVYVANARILEPLASRDRERFLDMLMRLIEGNFGYARPGAARRKYGSRKSPANRKE